MLNRYDRLYEETPRFRPIYIRGDMSETPGSERAEAGRKNSARCLVYRALDMILDLICLA